jgi:hypothetical protein
MLHKLFTSSTCAATQRTSAACKLAAPAADAGSKNHSERSKMKVIAIATAAASLLLGVAAHAQQAPAAGPLYGELGYSWAQIHGNGVKATPGAIRGIIGYDVHPNLAVEGMLEAMTPTTASPPN